MKLAENLLSQGTLTAYDMTSDIELLENNNQFDRKKPSACESNTDIIPSISDPLIQGWRVVPEPEYSKETFLKILYLDSG